MCGSRGRSPEIDDASSRDSSNDPRWAATQIGVVIGGDCLRSAIISGVALYFALPIQETPITASRPYEQLEKPANEGTSNRALYLAIGAVVDHKR